MTFYKLGHNSSINDPTGTLGTRYLFVPSELDICHFFFMIATFETVSVISGLSICAFER
jgi:hypothetical protein